MNPLNHFLLSFNILLIIFHNIADIKEILLFSLVFGALLDYDSLVSARQRDSNQGFGIKLFNKVDKGDLRSLIQEPFGFIIIGIPVAIFFAVFLKSYYFFLVIIPYALHVITDYMTIHKGATPFTPFSNKKIRIGFIRPMPAPPWFKEKKGFPEIYILLLNLIVIIVLLFTYI